MTSTTCSYTHESNQIHLVYQTNQIIWDCVLGQQEAVVADAKSKPRYEYMKKSNWNLGQFPIGMSFSVRHQWIPIGKFKFLLEFQLEFHWQMDHSPINISLDKNFITA